jgi:hypothetical protein
MAPSCSELLWVISRSAKKPRDELDILFFIVTLMVVNVGTI